MAQFIASTVHWPEVGAVITQKTKLSTQTGSNGGAKAVLALNLTVSPDHENRSNAASFGSHLGATTFNMKVRAPGWAAEGSTLVVLRAGRVLFPSSSTEATAPVVPGSFIEVPAPSGGWQSDDVVSASFVMEPRLKPINDKRPAYTNVAAIMIGPFVMGGLTNMSDVIVADPAEVGRWVVSTSSAAADDDDDEATVQQEELHLVAVGQNRNFTLVSFNLA